MKSPMKALIRTLALGGLLCVGAAQAGEEAELLYFKATPTNLPALQRGARTFINYCSGCHAMKYLRYSRMAKDLGIPEEQLKANLMFGVDKSSETIKTAMPAAAKDWFGQQPPDLSLEARYRGLDWVYTYLLSFYVDDKRPLGVNNTVLPNASMPHVLWEQQGWQKAKYKEVLEKGAKSQEFEGLELAEKGSMTPEQYREYVSDLVNFMAYAAEPGKAERISLGFRVFLYLVLLLILTYLLKKEFWRDVH